MVQCLKTQRESCAYTLLVFVQSHEGRESLGVQTSSYVITKGTLTKFLGTSSQAQLLVTIGFVQVMEKLEIQGIEEFHFPGQESHGT